MSKNILIFSDGTGQAGGLRFDEDRSNVYKLFRATRVGPDSCINPSEQVAFYDPGLGSQADGSNLWGRGFRRAIYNTVSQVTGFGITANIVDCYAAIIRLYEDNDRIFLFGFSRGAYTVRCLAGVLAQCGIPRNLPGDQPLKRDVPASQALAAYAVKHIYQFTETRKKDETNAYQQFLQSTRALIAKRFREQHKSFDSQNPENANVHPYFIGVFDTVAALGNWKKSVLFLTAFLIGALVVSFILSLLPLFLDAPILGYLTIKNVFTTLVIAAAAIALFLYLYTHIKFDFSVPGYSWWQKIKTFHLTSMWQTFYDRSLNPNVQYAKHAISIDENRSDFQRVEWSRFPSRSVRDEHGNIWFEQIWFPGSHADVGGSYNDNESRLSDGALKWMLACASVIPNGIKHDRGALQLFPDSSGMQHDERKAGLGLLTRRFNVTWRKQDRVLPIPEGEMKSKATMHNSVYDRFDLLDVLQHDCRCIYRPETLRNHVDFCDGYLDDGTTRARPNRTRNEAAVDTEAKFDKLMKARAAVADARGGQDRRIAEVRQFVEAEGSLLALFAAREHARKAMMFSNGLNWVGRFSFFAGILLGAIVLIGQCLYWLKTAEWPSVSFELGLTAMYFGPLHCSWLGVQQIFSFINGAPFTVSVFLLGTIVYFVLAWIADRIPPRWEQKETSSKQTGT